MRERYLGEGLYARDDGSIIELASRGGDQLVYLDQEMLYAFFRYLEESRGIKITITKAER